MSKVRYNPSALEHTHRYYTLSNPVSSQFLIVKGYKKVDDVLYFECYDPKSSLEQYKDNMEIKGFNRYYRSEDVWEAARAYGGWQYAVVVGKKYTLVTGMLNEVEPYHLPEVKGW
jgi:hypothetical protein